MGDRLSNDEFLSSLSSLLTSTHASNHGSIYLTQKLLSSTNISASDTVIPPQQSSQSQILIRATNGLSKQHRTDKTIRSAKPKIKLSTVVDVADLDVFYGRYADVCKRGMEGLRKRDKKRAKEKEKARKRKGGK